MRGAFPPYTCWNNVGVIAVGKIKERYIVDEHGNQVGVLLEIAEYRRLLEELEELSSIKAYDKAKASQDEIIPFEQAVSEIEQSRS